MGKAPHPRLPGSPILLAGCLALAVSLAVPSSALAQVPGNAQAAEGWLDVEVATVGIDLATGAPLALVHEGWDEVLPIWIGDNEAQAILQVLQGVAPPRPMTHDLMTSVLGRLDAELVEVRIHDMREGAYIGSLHLRKAGEDELIEVDSRPSDALALALRTDARIRVARRLLSGVPDVDFVSNERNRPISRLRGVTVAIPADEDRQRFDLREQETGVVVLHVPADATRSGLEPGDVIVAAGGRTVADLLSYLNAVQAAAASAPIPITVIRDGEEVRLELPPRRPPGPIG
jgi:uncharacterized protein